MKTKWIVAITLMCIGFAARAQDTNSYWVIENNTQTASSIIRFYDQQNNLIHAETVSGKKLKVTNRRHRKFLDQKLKTILKKEAIASGTKSGRN